MTAKWQAGKTYAPGALVTPTSTPSQTVMQPLNAGFETGDLTGWTPAQSGRWAVISGAGAYEGAYCAQASGSGLTDMGNDARVPVKPGVRVTVSAKVRLTNYGTDDAGGEVNVLWFDAAGTELTSQRVRGNNINGKGGVWKVSSASGVAPATAASFSILLATNNGTHGSTVEWDATSFSYAVQTVPAGLVYKATQAAPGKSGSVEPTWPNALGVSVTDNQVTWEGVIASQIVWQATPAYKSGASEPTWPTDVGAAIKDGTVNWTTATPMVADANCPHSKQVAIESEKVFAGDVDITRYSATGNPLDWTTSQDAGFIPHGLKSVQETEVTALGIYRGNLAIFTAAALQLWKADPDPAAITILDTVESVGTAYPRGMVPVEQDVFFVSPLGVRSISVSASQQAMGEGDIGNPMDPIVQSLVGPSVEPLAAFFPNLGQSLFFFGNQVVVLFKNKLSKLTGWALYTLPISVTDVTVLDGDLYVRDATDIYWFQLGNKTDYGNAFDVVLEWQYLDFGTPGTTKSFAGISLDADAVATVSAGYDVQVPTRRTGKKRLARVSERFLSLAFVGKSASFKAEFSSVEMDSFSRLNVYFRDGGAL